jgi:hypothetical protein
MISKLKQLLERVESWPETDQQELAEHAAEIESRRTGAYVLNGAEWADLQEGIVQGDRGEFVSDKTIAEADTRRAI